MHFRILRMIATRVHQIRFWPGDRRPIAGLRGLTSKSTAGEKRKVRGEEMVKRGKGGEGRKV